MASSPWAEIGSWLFLPVVVVVTGAGWGLVVERAARLRLPSALVVPVGFCMVMTLALFGHGVRLPWWLVTGGLAVISVAALAIERPAPSRIVGGWAGVVALLLYLLYMAPVLLTGHWTWTGYNFLNDTNFQFLLADWIRSGGPALHPSLSAAEQATRGYVTTDYPLGSHAHLAVLSALVRVPVEAAYQPYLGVCAAMGGMAVQYVLRAIGLRPILAALGASAALAASLTFQYGLQGSIKEVAFVATLFVAIAAAYHLLESDRPVGAAGVLGVAVAGALAAYSAAGLPYLGILVVIAFIALAFRIGWRDRLLWGALLVGVVVVLVLSLPTLPSVYRFAKTVNGAYVDAGPGGASTLGQLQAPLKLWDLGGVWLSGQYVNGLGGSSGLLTHLLDAVVWAAGLLGLVWAVARRAWGVVLLVAPAALAYAIVGPRVSAYVDAKMIAIAAPGFVAIAAVGLQRLQGRLMVVGAVLATAIVVGIGVSDALAIHDTNIAPTGRMEDIAALGEHYRGRGPVLFNEFEEFAKYFARDAIINPDTDSMSAQFIVPRLSTEGPLGHSYDLDQVQLAYIEQFRYVALRRKPSASRPPANYRLDYANTSYVVYKRLPGLTVLEHLPLGDVHHAFGDGTRATAMPSCSAVRKFVKGMPAGATIVAAHTPERATVTPPKDFDFISPGWRPDSSYPGDLALPTPGHADAHVDAQGGRYTVWVRGSFGRAVHVTVDGKDAGSVRGINTPGGWLKAGSVTIPAGRATVTLTRGGGEFKPGDGAHSHWGGIALVAPGAERLVDVPRADAVDRLCGHTWDWIESVHHDA